jgi:hypothetical protein
MQIVRARNGSAIRMLIRNRVDGPLRPQCVESHFKYMTIAVDMAHMRHNGVDTLAEFAC